MSFFFVSFHQRCTIRTAKAAKMPPPRLIPPCLRFSRKRWKGEPPAGPEGRPFPCQRNCCLSGSLIPAVFRACVTLARLLFFRYVGGFSPKNATDFFHT